MREERVVHVLEEQGCGVEGVKGDAVGSGGQLVEVVEVGVVEMLGFSRLLKRNAQDVQLYQVQLLLLGQDVFDVGLEFGVFLQHFGANCALGARFYFRFRASRNAG